MFSSSVEVLVIDHDALFELVFEVGDLLVSVGEVAGEFFSWGVVHL